MPEGDVLGLRDRTVANVATLRGKRPNLKIQLLCDGAPEMWNLLENGFTPKFGDGLHRLVDLYHLTEKLGAAAHVLEESSGAAAGERLGGWKKALLHRSSAPTDVLKDLIASERGEGVGMNHPVHETITYLQSHGCETDRMNYAERAGLACRLVLATSRQPVKVFLEMRMERCGARWKKDTGEHIVQLRALALSDRWEPAIGLTLRPLRKAVRAA